MRITEARVRLPIIGWQRVKRSVWAWLPVVRMVESAKMPWFLPYPPVLDVRCG